MLLSSLTRRLLKVLFFLLFYCSIVTPFSLDIIKKYSNFVGFPIEVNGERVNTIRAIWLASKDSVSEDEHKEFYQFIARAYDTPMYRLHYATDSPLNIRGLVSIFCFPFTR